METFTPKKQNIHSFQTHMEHFQTDQFEGHKTSLKKFKKIEIISSIFLEHNGLKLETNLKTKTLNYSNTWRVNNMLLNNKYVNNEIKGEMKKYLETNENEHTTT